MTTAPFASGAATSSTSPSLQPAAPTDWRHGNRTHDGDVVARESEGSFLSQRALATTGIVMLSLGLFLVAAAGYAVLVLSDRGRETVALMVGGFGGMTLAMVGGFLYCGSWIARLVEDSRAANRRLAETLLALVDVTAQVTAASANVGALHVTVGGGTVVHRRDCPLVAYRPDLAPADPEDAELSVCRVCRT